MLIKDLLLLPGIRLATLVPTGTDSQGNITQMMNLSYTNPYDYLSRPFARLIAEAERRRG